MLKLLKTIRHSLRLFMLGRGPILILPRIPVIDRRFYVAFYGHSSFVLGATLYLSLGTGQLQVSVGVVTLSCGYYVDRGPCSADDEIGYGC